MENERDLVLQCLANEVKAQKMLYDQFAPRMFGMCLRYAQSEMEAEDILQDGFYRVFRRLHQFRFECPLEGWIKVVIISVALNHIQKNGKFDHTVELSNACEVISFAPDALSELSMKELLVLIRKLPEGRRTVFNLYIFEGYDHREISLMLGISEGTSKSQLSRAKKALRCDITKQ